MSDHLRDLVLRDMSPPFSGTHARLDYTSAIRADIDKQHYSAVPQYWYVDATFRCNRCKSEFCFSAEEQKLWYEHYFIWVFVHPNKCLNCRRELRRLKSLKQRYDQGITNAIRSKDIEQKLDISMIIDELVKSGVVLPQKAIENRTALAKQIGRAQNCERPSVASPPT